MIDTDSAKLAILEKKGKCTISIPVYTRGRRTGYRTKTSSECYKLKFNIQEQKNKIKDFIPEDPGRFSRP
jgi:hypothetical protein